MTTTQTFGETMDTQPSPLPPTTTADRLFIDFDPARHVRDDPPVGGGWRLGVGLDLDRRRAVLVGCKPGAPDIALLAEIDVPANGSVYSLCEAVLKELRRQGLCADDIDAWRVNEERFSRGAVHVNEALWRLTGNPKMKARSAGRRAGSLARAAWLLNNLFSRDLASVSSRCPCLIHLMETFLGERKHPGRSTLYITGLTIEALL